MTQVKHNRPRIHRLPKGSTKFARIPAAQITNLNLSDFTYRVWSYLIDKPGYWRVRIKDIVKVFECSRRKATRVFAELKGEGLASATKTKTEAGLWKWEFQIFATPQPGIHAPNKAIPCAKTSTKPYAKNGAYNQKILYPEVPYTEDNSREDLESEGSSSLDKIPLASLDSDDDYFERELAKLEADEVDSCLSSFN